MFDLTATTPIAIVGIGCRFPGGAHGTGRFWSLLERGECVIGPVPPERWSARRHYDPDAAAPRRSYVREGGYLEGPVDRFDAAAFNISPREATMMDPQQRVLLEVAAEALEDAHIPRGQIAGTNTGVYVGAFTVDYQALMMRPENVHLVNSHTAAGMSLAAISNRLSHALDLKGASISIDTACSASLVAIHYACNDLRQGVVDTALAGGVNVTLLPEFMFALCKGAFVSPQARSRAFDIAADGYARGEGAGILVLKPLHRAEADGDPIHGLIHTSGINQDGRTDGISQPCVEAQKALIERVHAAAGLAPEDLAFVETHGTGTQVGDQTEARAIGEAIGQRRDRLEPILLGTQKPNIGHLEAAAGVASVIKSVLSLHHGVLPRHPLMKEPNPAIDFRSLNLRVPYENEPLYPQEGRRFAGINGFGYGGTNAHVIVSSYEATDSHPRHGCEDGILFLSAQTEAQLRQDAAALATHLEEGKATEHEACAASARLRTAARHRLAIPLDDQGRLTDRLRDSAAATAGPGAPIRQALVHQGLVFAFSGMGAQYVGMGRALLETEPAFAGMVGRIDETFRDHWQVSPRDLLLADQLPTGRADIPQWTNFTLQLGLCAMLRNWGIVPTGIYGHSAGEVAAAWASGCLSLDQAIRVAYWRGAILQELAGAGGMLALGLGRDDAMELLAGAPELDLAAINGPASTTVSGPKDAIARMICQLESTSVFHRLLDTPVAYHSRMVDVMEDGFSDDLDSIRPQAPHTPWISTVTPDCAAVPDAAYWSRNARQPVLFETATGMFLDAGETLFLEIGAHPVLGREIIGTAVRAGIDATCVSTLRRDMCARDAIARTKSQFFVSGGCADWQTMTRRSAPRHGALPLPSWADTRFFSESPESCAQRTGPADHPLLGRRLALPAATWAARLSTRTPAFLSGHSVLGKIVFPAASYLEMGLAAALQTGKSGQIQLRDVEFRAPLVLLDDKEVRVSARIDPDGRFEISSGDEAGNAWTKHAMLRIAPLDRMVARPRDIAALLDAAPAVVTAAEFYRRLDGVGLGYAGLFRQGGEIRVGPDHAIARMELGRQADMLVHPCVLDGAFQIAMSLLPELRLMLPKSAKALTFLEKPVGTCFAVAHRTGMTSDEVTVDIELLAEDGRLCLAVEGLTCAELATVQINDPVGWTFWSAWPQLEPSRGTVRSGAELILNGESKEDWQELFALGCMPHEAGRQSKSARPSPDTLIYICPRHAEIWADAYMDLAAFIAAQAEATPGQIVIVTRDCQGAVSGDAAGNPHHAGFWGIARSMQLDFPDLALRLVDFPPISTISNFRDLMRFCARSGPKEAVLRNGGIYGHTLRAFSKRAYRENQRVIRKPGADMRAVLDASQSPVAWASVPPAPCPAGGVVLRIDSVAPAPEFPERFDACATVIESGGPALEPDTVLALSGGSELLATHVEGPGGLVWARWDGKETPATTLCAALKSALGKIAAGVPLALMFEDSRNIRAALDWLEGCGRNLAVLGPANAGEHCRGATFIDIQSFDAPRDLRSFLGETGALFAAPETDITRIASDDFSGYLHPPVTRKETAADGPDRVVCFDTEIRWAGVAPEPNDLRTGNGQALPLLRPNASALPVLVTPRTLAEAPGVTVVTGGVSGFGAELAVGLSALGCRALALIGRRGGQTPGVDDLVARLRRHGARVRVLAVDVSDLSALATALDALRSDFGAIGAVYHCAGAVGSLAPSNLTAEAFAEALAAKCAGAMNLDTLTRQDPLVHFCTIGSVAGLIGNRNQAPYAAANAVLSALSAGRRARGQVSFNAILGAVDSAGQVADNAALKSRLAGLGVNAMNPETVVERIHALCGLNASHSMAIADMDWSKWESAGAGSPVAQLALAGGVSKAASGKTQDLSSVDLALVVETALSSCLQIDADKVTRDTPIGSLGLDSLVATEMSLFVQTATGLVLDPIDVLSTTNVGALVDLLEQKRDAFG